MNFNRCYDVELIKKVSFSMWDDIMEEGYQRDYFEPDLVRRMWFTVTEGNDMLGLIAFEIVSLVCLRVHPLILHEHRKKHLEILSKCSAWYLDMCRLAPYKKVIAEIPDYMRHIHLAVLKIGFKEEGVRSKSYMRHGNLCDVNLYGATNAQLKERI